MRLRFATPRQRTTDNGQWSGGSRHSELRNYGFTELRKLASLCYAGQQTTDNGNGGQSRLIAMAQGSQPFSTFCTFLGQQTTEAMPELRNYGITELRKLASLCYSRQRTTDNGQWSGAAATCSLVVSWTRSLRGFS